MAAYGRRSRGARRGFGMCPHEEIGVPGPAAEGTREGSGEAISIDCGSPVISLMEHSADPPANAISWPVLEGGNLIQSLDAFLRFPPPDPTTHEAAFGHCIVGRSSTSLATPAAPEPRASCRPQRHARVRLFDRLPVGVGPPLPARAPPRLPRLLRLIPPGDLAPPSHQGPNKTPDHRAPRRCCWPRVIASRLLLIPVPPW